MNATENEYANMRHAVIYLFTTYYGREPKCHLSRFLSFFVRQVLYFVQFVKFVLLVRPGASRGWQLCPLVSGISLSTLKRLQNVLKQRTRSQLHRVNKINESVH